MLSPAEQFSQNLVQHLNMAKDFACLHGLLKKTTDGSPNLIASTILPSPFPEKPFHHALSLQKEMNLLFHKVACDHEFLLKVMPKAVACDEYLANLWSIYLKTREEGLCQPYFLCMNRADYMVDYVEGNDDHFDEKKLKMVEFNLMASSFSGLSAVIPAYHRTMLQHLCGYSVEETQKRVPANVCGEGMAGGIVKAWKFYDVPHSAVLFVVSDNELNVFDQRRTELFICKIQPGLRVVRKSFQALTTEATLTADRRLLVNGVEIAVIYFRLGYVPEHFHTKEIWDLKMMLERSRALKCPSIQHMIANTKKIQQVLSEPGILERFIDNRLIISQIRETFMGQFDLTNRQKVADALRNPDRYVLKPHREGGGNNFFKDNLYKKLNSLSATEESAYILMERIRPVPFKNYILFGDRESQLFNMVSELGTFGVLIGSSDHIIENYESGYLLRSKCEEIDEGGVATGFACLDTPLLTSR